MTANLLAALLVFLIYGNAMQEDYKPLIIADAYYWTGAEGNLGLEIIGKFQSENQLKDTLNLSKDIGVFKGKKYPFEPKNWTLCDILISAEFNANGYVAIWRLSGPKPLLLSYLDRLKQGYEDKSMFYDFSYRFMDFKPSTD